ncbi:4-hydroxythreonine-4-phosphate dehydrogenase PdxA [Thermosulfuriphilus ammonigenes]|uniref:4-hydroxythreonine-4-phosphate dehydrogenase n=1 Tax=Thermosulfuriphilus ammonigenes TaxID=1936021 RepID=A0A6G7PW53_9BACT|nr:4-hydroxythreonine-4-phosphate dehydrogenase PdxA [Thermosulfuriphilus ammonigenes]MBA2847959.1 4-hydroxythreonine-4-phosphate dehydrogenase [Thermosulfuriphilus ammonigenes]QIJ71850.1 4-hydroxythreonine-4-phosphate dehydrogenase PdxA [Thermosulfuriphilus ammonigenes]
MPAARPKILITMGCPAGIGPEIVLKALGHPEVYDWCRPEVVGDELLLKETAKRLGLPWPSVPIHSLTNLKGVRPGRPSAATGQASYLYVTWAARACLQGEAEAMVTAPISKWALSLAGVKEPGHTEILARLTGCTRFAMMMAGERLRVVLATIHLALSQVPQTLSLEGLGETICLAYEALRRDFAIDHPRLAVAALNPHAGEEGLFGDEEKRIIQPAIELARAKGIEASGPYPADSLFYRAAQGEFDLVVAMYHDQGLIPFKLLHFRDGVNITIGLPLIRTSVDHGTAYDLAGSGQADESSLLAAIKLAAIAARNRGRDVYGQDTSFQG